MPKNRKKSQKQSDSSDSANRRGAESPKPAEKPVTLHPLAFEEAVRDLLRVKPEPGKVRLPNRGAANGDKGQYEGD